MRLKLITACVLMTFMILSCREQDALPTPVAEQETTFEYLVDEFADLRVLRYQVPGFDSLDLQKKKLVYYLTMAGLAGRDIVWDQNYRYNLGIRKALENVYTKFQGDTGTTDWKAFETYLKRVWFSNGIHHHYSNDKLPTGFSRDYLRFLLAETNTTLDSLQFEILFNDKDQRKVNKRMGLDNVRESAVNFYAPEITAEDVKNFYAQADAGPEGMPIELGLNSKLVKENGRLVEKVWKSGGMYGSAIDEIIKWLEKAREVAENEPQSKALGLLIAYYKTGNLHTWDEYAIAWVNSTAGDIDWINGFVEVYYDPAGYKAYYESIVQIKDFEMSAKMDVLSENAQWFEDHSPLMDAHKKENVVGITYNTVIVAGEAGGVSPSTPIGVNLPNNNWIRQEHGSKSVSLGNIVEAHNNAGNSGRLEEFAFDEEEIELEKKYGIIADKLHTALHEVIGHASGRINDGVGQPKETLKNYSSTIEEGRADLIALYYQMDPKLQELGLVDDWEAAGKAAYDAYIRNGLLTQLIRIQLGDNVEEDHMVNRQWVSAWVYEKGKDDGVIERVSRDGKTFYNIKDYNRLRELFGELLREVQRIKSEGDFGAAQELVENYGVKVERTLHEEVLNRNARFKTAPYSGFVNPTLEPILNDEGEILDIELKQAESFEGQMLDYGKRFDFLDPS